MICEECDTEFVHRAETVSPKYRRAHRFCSERCANRWRDAVLHELLMALNEIRFVGNRFAKQIAERVISRMLPA